MIKNLIRKFVLGWAINIFALYLACYFIEEIKFKNDLNHWIILIIAALIFGTVNAFLKPVLKIITIPLFPLKGIVFFLANGFLLYFISWLMPVFRIPLYLPLLEATIIVSIINFVLHLIV